MAMFKDIALWTLVSLVFTGGFTVAFVAISDPAAVHASPDHPITVPMWAMLGVFDVHEVDRWNPGIGAILLWLYVVVAQIILVNLLIAMMGDTFGTIKERADEEWKFGRIRSVMEATERMHPVPPPFNLPITFLAFACWLVEGTRCGDLLCKGQTAVNTYDYATNKKLKAKVAKRLMLRMKRMESEAVVATLDGQDEKMDEYQLELKQEIKELRGLVAAIQVAQNQVLMKMTPASASAGQSSAEQSSAEQSSAGVSIAAFS